MKSKIKSLMLKTKIYNYFLLCGNKIIIEKIVLKSFKILQKIMIKYSKNLLKFTMVNVTPVIKIKQIKKKKRKTITEFPFILNQKIRKILSIKLISKFLNKKKGLNICTKLSTEFLTIFKNKSFILKKNYFDQNNAFTKKKYIFFRWFC